jgi:hypothetical protein
MALHHLGQTDAGAALSENDRALVGSHRAGLNLLGGDLASAAVWLRSERHPAPGVHIVYAIESVPDRALAALDEAVGRARPGGFIRTFIDLGPSLQGLLVELARRRVPPDPYVQTLLAAFSATSGPPGPAVRACGGGRGRRAGRRR